MTTTPRRTKAQIALEEREEARDNLRAFLPVGSTVFVIQRHVSKSGMMRHLSLLALDKGHLRDITYLAALAMGDKVYDGYGTWYLKVGGCGMDMHFATVYSLSRALYPDGFECNGNKGPNSQGGCPSNDHSNDYSQAVHEWADEHPNLAAAIYSADPDESRAAHDARRHYVDRRLSSDLGYTKGRKHTSGGYALHHRTI